MHQSYVAASKLYGIADAHYQICDSTISIPYYQLSSDFLETLGQKNMNHTKLKSDSVISLAVSFICKTTELNYFLYLMVMLILD